MLSHNEVTLKPQESQIATSLEATSTAAGHVTVPVVCRMPRSSVGWHRSPDLVAPSPRLYFAALSFVQGIAFILLSLHKVKLNINSLPLPNRSPAEILSCSLFGFCFLGNGRCLRLDVFWSRFRPRVGWPRVNQKESHTNGGEGIGIFI